MNEKNRWLMRSLSSFKSYIYEQIIVFSLSIIWSCQRKKKWKELAWPIERRKRCCSTSSWKLSWPWQTSLYWSSDGWPVLFSLYSLDNGQPLILSSVKRRFALKVRDSLTSLLSFTVKHTSLMKEKALLRSSMSVCTGEGKVLQDTLLFSLS